MTGAAHVISQTTNPHKHFRTMLSWVHCQFQMWLMCVVYLPIPKCVFILAYRAVPVRFLFSRYGMCWCVLASLYFLAKPKSIMYTKFPFLPSPMRKLSGLTSLWMKFLECMYSIRLIWKANTKSLEMIHFRWQHYDEHSWLSLGQIYTDAYARDEKSDQDNYICFQQPTIKCIDKFHI